MWQIIFLLYKVLPAQSDKLINIIFYNVSIFTGTATNWIKMTFLGTVFEIWRKTNWNKSWNILCKFTECKCWQVLNNLNDWMAQLGLHYKEKSRIRAENGWVFISIFIWTFGYSIWFGPSRTNWQLFVLHYTGIYNSSRYHERQKERS